MTFELFALVYLCISMDKGEYVTSQFDFDYLENSGECIF